MRLKPSSDTMLDLKTMIDLKEKPPDILFIEASALPHEVPACLSLKCRMVSPDDENKTNGFHQKGSIASAGFKHPQLLDAKVFIQPPS